MAVIQTRVGQLRGKAKQSLLNGETYYGFLGIPYAKPPVGNLRFRAPQPFDNWEGIRDATQEGNDPLQSLMQSTVSVTEYVMQAGDEDCLYLNVFIKELPDKSHPKKPVIFSIYGGGFAGGTGSSKQMGPDYFMEENIVFVSFNYRCGAFGFLSLENKRVPGNAGLKDQVLALQWVRDNIDSFGGDPNNVTIQGISAGGASVHYQLLSPRSKGLFHKAIIQSGFASNSWAFNRTPRATTIKLAKQMGCLSNDNDEILSFLQSAQPNDIVAATKAISIDQDFLETSSFVFRPCVEVPSHDSFITDSPDRIMERGLFNKVPVILGATTNEGSLLTFCGGINDKGFEEINKNPNLLVPSFLGLNEDSEKKEAQKAIRDFYFKGNPVTWDNVDLALQYHGDILINLGLDAARRSLVEKSSLPVFSYIFTNHSRCVCSSLKAMFEKPEHVSKVYTSDTCHGADSLFIYNATLFGPCKVSDTDRVAIHKHIKIWTTFALTGNPNCKELDTMWKTDSANQPCYMDIGPNWNMREGIPFADRMDFWKKLHSKYCNGGKKVFG